MVTNQETGNPVTQENGDVVKERQQRGREGRTQAAAVHRVGNSQCRSRATVARQDLGSAEGHNVLKGDSHT